MTISVVIIDDRSILHECHSASLLRASCTDVYFTKNPHPWCLYKRPSSPWCQVALALRIASSRSAVNSH